MIRRGLLWGIFACLSGLLYFFENNTGTRMVLAAALLLPLIPPVRRSLFGKDREAAGPQASSASPPASSPAPPSAAPPASGEEPDGVRTYVPGDPVNRVHWKLSAKREELLVREWCRSAGPEEEAAADSRERKPSPKLGAQSSFTASPGLRSAKVRRSLAAFLMLSLALLLLLPAARDGVRILLNRLFDESEAVNAYRYERFPVAEGRSVLPALVPLALAALSLAGLALGCESRVPALLLAAGLMLFQIWFGLSFPAWGNGALLILFALRMLRRPPAGREIRNLLAAAGALFLAVGLLFPGVDAATEAASEALRDRLSRMAGAVAGEAGEAPEGETEARRVHSRAPAEGTEEARPERAFRLVTLAEKQISRPHWVDALRIALLLLASAALLVLPFLPFLWLNARRKKALEARRVFDSENISEAVAGIFQQVTAWLEATGHGGGNQPYARWAADLSPAYAERFSACEKLFEEAAYSTHEMREEQRQQALRLLEETERTLKAAAGWRERIRLKYRECLWC
ncbi:MAG: DUF58 domain-containing protein [Clostridia bacterium]|nr:DUF58 domain-containing protein [Clostridia bacterium]